MKNEKLARVALNKSTLKEYSSAENERIVYLDDGNEFQIELFNPYNFVLGVSFSYNSSDNNNKRLLVLKPGERVWLDRFLNDNKKLKFSTYEVQDNNTVKKAIKDNGRLDIYFYKEVENYISVSPSITIDFKDYYHYYDNPNSTSVFTNNPTSVASCDNSVTDVSAYGCSAPSTVTYTNASTCDLGVTRSSLCGNEKSIETGRIEKGSVSYQDFNNYYGDFSHFHFKKETIKLLPSSMKPVNKCDLAKRYCINCGRKRKDKFKYCPYCGKKQDI